ncbi:hypothetical protein F4815DRAFT_447655 [Daldinia loculata]|nr:hypothetical protein F4815DRAFT_447655 [Daldinia loculata]
MPGFAFSHAETTAVYVFLIAIVETGVRGIAATAHGPPPVLNFPPGLYTIKGLANATLANAIAEGKGDGVYHLGMNSMEEYLESWLEDRLAVEIRAHIAGPCGCREACDLHKA